MLQRPSSHTPMPACLCCIEDGLRCSRKVGPSGHSAAVSASSPAPRLSRGRSGCNPSSHTSRRPRAPIGTYLRGASIRGALYGTWNALSDVSAVSLVLREALGRPSLGATGPRRSWPFAVSLGSPARCACDTTSVSLRVPAPTVTGSLLAEGGCGEARGGPRARGSAFALPQASLPAVSLCSKCAMATMSEHSALLTRW
jgi:hypothetical protein